MELQNYQEVMANIRHYSSLRFAMLTVFVAITGGLLSAAHSPSIEIDETALCINVIRFAGIWVAVVFLTFEVALNIYLSGLWAEAGNSNSAYRHWAVKWAVRIAAGSITVMAILYWIFVYGS